VARGKFLFVGDDKFLPRGVTYGPFRPDARGCAYHTPEVVKRDFAHMAEHGVNAVRTYTCPPRWLLDVAAEEGLRVMVGVGLAGEQQTAFLDDRKTVRGIRQRCADEVRACAGHRALLAYAIGNEIPATIARWYGRGRVERFLREMCDLTREHDPEGLVTYVNYPTTEYLQLPFLDFLSFNVYLEAPEKLEAYIARLQSIADYRPLVMAEVGLDSLRNGPDAQGASVAWQVRAAFAGGCAGAFVFAWTDEWHTGGCDVEDWKFGVTDAQRRPKPALHALRAAFAETPLPASAPGLPRISVVCCTYNGSPTIADCLQGCALLKYPDFEVIVVNDGSTDGTAALARGFDVRLINTPNRGLSHARNVGLMAATGEIVAYIDDDARPDEHWLRYLAHTFLTSGHVGVGGPNIAPADDPPVAKCVANAPGGPTHVLITDRLAEHIPGCNMAFRTSRLREIGGFDTQFRIAGDDVDVCWRLQARGWTLGFNPAAVVWHRRRSSIRAYWKQQVNYGRAEAMLERKWPAKYNALGHVGWRGRLYGGGAGGGCAWPRSRVYHGVWASSPFQSLCTSESPWAGLPQTPEWCLGAAALFVLGALGLLWSPLLGCLPVAALAAGMSLIRCARGAARAPFPGVGRPRGLALRATTAALHLVQPVARLWGRLSYGLTPWRRRAPGAIAVPRVRTVRIWCEQWQPAHERLAAIETMLQQRPLPVRRGGEYDDWDLEVRGGLFACVRTRLGVEEYPRGHQYLRFRIWPCLGTAAGLVAVCGGLAAAAAAQRSTSAALVLAAFAALLVRRALGDYGAAAACLRDVCDRYRERLAEVRPDDTSTTAPLPDAREQLRPRREADSPARGVIALQLGVGGALRTPVDERCDLVAGLARSDALDPPACVVGDGCAERAG
jgi:GT2 family glycosyltransferase